MRTNKTSVSIKAFKVVAALVVSAATAVCASQGDHGKPTVYQQVNLVSDQPGVALLQDTNLVNAWGISFAPTGPFWLSANGTGISPLYAVTNDSSGVHVTKLALEVTIPGEGSVSGQLFNSTTNFNGDLFIFVSEDGTVSGWRPALGTAAEVLTTRNGGVYKGVTLAATTSGPLLLAANFAEATVDVYDGSMNLLGQLQDTNAPAGYAPFNVKSINGTVYVTFAKQDADKKDDVAGAGHGLIDVLDLQSMTFHRFATGKDAHGHFKAINSPWGIALAPDSFGKHAGQLLVGNFGSGTIMTFDQRGHFKGFLESNPGRPVTIDGLWGLSFGNDARAGSSEILYFSAGPSGESHGLFGSLQFVGKQKGNGRN